MTEPSPAIDTIRPILHVGLVGLDWQPPDEGAGLPERVRGILAAVAGAAATLREAKRPGADLLSGAMVLRLLVLADAPGADRLSASAVPDGWSIQRLHVGDTADDAAAADFAVIDAQHRVDARLALQTVLIEQSDLVLVSPAGGDPASRIAFLREAHEAGVPLVMLDGPDATALISAVVERTLLPGGGSPDAAKLAGEAAAFLQDTVPSTAIRAVYRAYEAALMVGTRAAEAPPVSRPDRPDASGGPLKAVQASLAARIERADRIAGIYGDRYRVAALARILLSLLALIGLFFAFYFADVVRGMHGLLGGPAAANGFHRLETLGYGLDVASILGVLALAALADRRAWHNRFITARYVAEHLRQLPALAALGRGVTGGRATTAGIHAAPDWPTWYIRAVTRSLGLPAARVTAPYRLAVRDGLDDVVADQIRFYTARAHKFETLGKRLWRLANTCYWLGIAAVLARLAVFAWAEDNDVLRLLANLGCFIFPAFAPIFTGLRAQGEYPKLAQRYAAMAETLRARLQHDQGRPDEGFADAAETVRRTVALMLDEVAEWRLLIKSHTISRL